MVPPDLITVLITEVDVEIRPASHLEPMGSPGDLLLPGVAYVADYDLQVVSPPLFSKYLQGLDQLFRAT